MNLTRRFPAIHSKVYFRAGILFYILFTILTLNLPFFGDHVSLISAPANFIYDTSFHTLILPDELNSGHPPFYALLHAVVWKVFGRTLIASHCITLLATLLLYVQFVSFSKKIHSEQQLPIAILLFVAQPVIITQVSLMSTDILLCAMFLLGLNSIISGKRKLLAVAIAISLLISLRGFLTVGFLFICELILSKGSGKQFFRMSLFYFLSALPALCWHIYHYTETGWMLANPISPWAAGRDFVSFKYLPGKVFEYALRFIEFGMIIPWLVIIISLRKLFQSVLSRPYIRILIAGLLFFSLFIIFFRNPVMLRYLLPLQIICLVLTAKMLSEIVKPQLKRILTGSIAIVFIAHHFFAYPQMRSSVFEYSWGEGSLAHLSYFKFREQGKSLLEAHSIQPAKVYTGFPDYKSFNDTNLNGEYFGYQPIPDNGIQSCPYIFYSNIMNGITKDTELELKNNWIRLGSYYAYPVEYVLFKNPETIKIP